MRGRKVDVSYNYLGNRIVHRLEHYHMPLWSRLRDVLRLP